MPATKERQRVSRACDFCKRKKIRCSGDHPCQLCIRDSRECTFDAPYARGKNKRKRRKPGDEGSSISVSLPKSTSVTPNDGDASSASVRVFTHRTDTSSSTSGGQSTSTPSRITHHDFSTVGDGPDASLEFPPVHSRASPEPGESDSQGRFVGASSGLSLLLRLQRRLRQEVGNITETSVFTLGDPVLPDFDEALFTWPDRQEADVLLRTYFDLASPTYRFLHRPTIELWLQQLYENGSIAEPCSNGKASVILSMFAQATGYLGASIAANPRSIQFFQAAERQLSLQSGTANLINVQALLGCCFYTLTCSRLNHCWTLFGTTARIILALGLHRRKPRYGNTSPPHDDVIEPELRKRLFWCAYVLDKYLSTIFGRPCALNDDDTDQEFPALADDDQDLGADHLKIADQDSMSMMLGPVCHQKLGRILGFALKRLYGVKCLDRHSQLQAMCDLGAQLDTWKKDLPAFLNPAKVDSRLLRPLFQRQSNLLSLASGHLEILIYRSCLLTDYSNSLTVDPEVVAANIQRCLEAAMSIVGTITVMSGSEQLYPVSWFTHYQAFCAVVILYTYTIKSRHKDPSSWLKYFQAAERCQAMIAKVPGRESLAHRLILIMEEYRTEVVTQVHLDSPGAVPASQPTPIQSQPDASWMTPSNMNDLMFTELPDWEQLNSLALDTGLVDFDVSMLSPQLV